MPLLQSIIGLVVPVIDKVIPDAHGREKAKLELLRLEGSPELQEIEARLSAIAADAHSRDRWTSRARPSFLYLMYVMLLFAIPMGILSAFDPSAAKNISHGMTGYLNSLPDELYVLFGTGYLGYTAARQWGKVQVSRL